MHPIKYFRQETVWEKSYSYCCWEEKGENWSLLQSESCWYCLGLLVVWFSLFVQTLVRLPPKISEDPFILEFFEVRDTDINKPGWVHNIQYVEPNSTDLFFLFLSLSLSFPISCLYSLPVNLMKTNSRVSRRSVVLSYWSDTWPLLTTTSRRRMSALWRLDRQ